MTSGTAAAVVEARDAVMVMEAVAAVAAGEAAMVVAVVADVVWVVVLASEGA